MFRPVLIAATLALLVSACTTVTPTTSPSSPATGALPSSPAPTTPTSPPPPALPDAYDQYDVSGFRSTCTVGSSAGRAFPGAAAYAGKAPHPIAFFGYGEVSDWNSGLFVTAADDDKAIDKWYAEYTSDLQLVACVNARRGKRIRDCGTYAGTTSSRVERYWGEYTIDVYETRTARPVAKGLRLRGATETDCPIVVSRKTPEKGVIKLITELTGKQMYAALRAYVLK